MVNPEKFLADHVSVLPHYQRSIRLDIDINKEDVLSSYILNDSSLQILEEFSKAVSNASQSAFTWTGSYGTGKSSLAVFLTALTSSNKRLRSKAIEMLFEKTGCQATQDLFGKKKNDWIVIPLTGDRRSIVDLINAGIRQLSETSGNAKVPKYLGKPPTTIEGVIQRLEDIRQRTGLNVLIIVDEFGKVLESYRSEGRDINDFQNLAELLARSPGRSVFLGILHQALEAYASRQSQETRTEWNKVQGRFIDFALRTTADELISLAARAIDIDYASSDALRISREIFPLLKETRPSIDPGLEGNLRCCWPLHPTSALLLSSLTRKSFSQSQRSFFGFLSSLEPSGFKEFLAHTPFGAEACFRPEHLFDYILANLDSSLSDSRDGKKWATILEALSRVEGRHTALHLSVFKTIALFDLLKEPASLKASDACLGNIFSVGVQRLNDVLQDLTALKVVTFRKYLGTWALFEGSDFDVESAISHAIESVDGALFSHSVAGDYPPVVAKQHLSRTGCMRWINRAILDAQSFQAGLLPSIENGAVAAACVIVGASQDELSKISSALLDPGVPMDENYKHVVWGIPVTNSSRNMAIALYDDLRRLGALERVWLERPELEGDEVARREVRGQLEVTRSAFESHLESLSQSVVWFSPALGLSKPTSFSSLSKLASYVSDIKFPLALPIRNELLNRESVSSSAMKALKELMWAMLEAEPLEDLGLNGWPAERGIYASVVKATSHHIKQGDVWRFECSSTRGDEFGQLWADTDMFLKSPTPKSLPELYAYWEASAYGIKGGLGPLLVWLYLLSRKREVVFYFDGVFQPKLLAINADELLRRPKEFSLRYLEVAEEEIALLTELSIEFASRSGQLIPDDPLSVARAVVHQFRVLPLWTRRTMMIDVEDRSIRTQVLKAVDPNQLLFVVLPELFGTKDPKVITGKLLQCLTKLDRCLPELVEKIWVDFMRALEALGPTSIRFNDLCDRVVAIPEDLLSPGLRLMKQRFLVIKAADNLNSVTQKFSLICAAVGKTEKDFVDHDIGAVKTVLYEWALEFRKLELQQHLTHQSKTRSVLTVGLGLPGASSRLATLDVDSELVDQHSELAQELSKRIDHLTTAQKIACLVGLAASIQTEEQHG